MKISLSRIVTTFASSIGLLAAGALAAPSASADPDRTVRTSGDFSFVYDTSLVPTGANVAVHVTYPANGATIVTLHVRGLLPNREYGAHAHKFACGSAPSAAGGHYQYIVGGEVSPENEIWLDFTTNDAGNGSAQAVVDWQFTPDRRAHAVVVHAHGSEVPGANPRAACRTVDF